MNMKFINRLLAVTLLFILSLWLAWWVSTDQQKEDFSQWAKAIITNDGQRMPKSIDTPFGNYDLTWAWEYFWPESGELPVISYSPRDKGRISYRHVYKCKPPKTDDITHKRVVYQWKDTSGKTHYGDKPPQKDYRDLHVKNLRIDNYFSLKTNVLYGKIPPFTQDKVRHGVTEIYKTLSDVIRVAELKRVDLTMSFYGNRQRFREHKNNVAPGMSNLATGFYSHRTNGISILMQGNRDFVVNIAKHEATHAIIAGMFGGAPIWLNEGLAEFFEGMEENPHQKKKFKVNKAHIKLLRSNRLPSLREHFSQTPEEWYDDRHSKLNYAIDWSLAYFMMTRSDRIQFLRLLLDKLAVNGCQSVNTVEYINSHYKGGLAQLEREWRAWLAQVQSGGITFN